MNIGTNQVIEPFPWRDGDGLSTVLRDPSVWSTVFDLEDRHAVKRAAKKNPSLMSLPLPTVMKVRDDALMGLIVVDFLSSRQGRKELEKEFQDLIKQEGFRWNVLLANRLYNRYLGEKEFNLPKLEEVCEERRPDYWCIIPAKFAKWLTLNTPEPEDYRVLAIYSCAFALLQPDEAREIRKAFGEKSCFDSLLSDKTLHETIQELVSQESESSTQEPIEVVSEIIEDLTSVEPTSNMPVNVKSVLSDPSSIIDLLRNSVGNQDRLSVVQLQEYSKLLNKNFKDCSNTLQKLQDMKARLGLIFEKISKSPWLKQQIDIKTYLSLDDNALVATTLPQLHQLESQTSNLLGLVEQADELAKRLDKKPAPEVEVQNAQIPELVVRFDELINRLKSELEDVTYRDQETECLLGELAKANLENSLRLIEQTDADRWCEICRFILFAELGTDTTKKYQQFLGKTEIAGAILLHLWVVDRKIATDFIQNNVCCNLKLVREDRIRLLAHLGIDRLEQLASVCAHAANEISETIFSLSIGSRNLEWLEYLEPILYQGTINPICRAYYRAVLDAYHSGRIIDPTIDLNLFGISAEMKDRESYVKVHKQRLLDLINEPVGMGGTYGKLRVIAKVKFLSPLKELIQEQSADELQRKWNAYEGFDAMLASIEAYLQSKSGGRIKSLDHNQIQQTKNYLENFQRELEVLCAMVRQQRFESDEDLIRTSQQLKEQAEVVPDGNCASLFKMIMKVLSEKSAVELCGQSLGQYCSQEGVVRIDIPELKELVSPTMLHTWPVAVSKGEVKTSRFVCDLLWAALGLSPKNYAQAFSEYLEMKEFQAANRVVELDNSLAETFNERIEAEKDSLCSEFPDVLEQAEKARHDDEMIDYWLSEIETALESFEFGDVISYLSDLEGLVTEYNRIRVDPQRYALATFLNQTDLEFDETAPLEELESYIEMYRSENTIRRQHVVSLLKIADNNRLPVNLREQWIALGDRIDYPKLWLPEDLSDNLAEAIHIFEKCIVGKLQHRTTDPEVVDEIVDGLRQWVPIQISLALEGEAEKDMAELQSVLALARDIAGYCPDTVILDAIGKSTARVMTNRPATLLQPGMRAVGTLSGAKIPSKKDLAVHSRETIREIRELLKSKIRAEHKIAAGEQSQLLEACRAFDWKEVRTATAHLIPKNISEESLDEAEAIYTIALVHSISSHDDEVYQILKCACLACIMSRTDIRYYLRDHFLDQFSVKSFIAMSKEPTAINLMSPVEPAELKAVLEKIEISPKSDIVYQRLSQLLLQAGYLSTSKESESVASKLAENLWETLKGLKNAGKYRSCLLSFLYRIRLTSCLKHLAKQYGSPYQGLIVSCITGFGQAEADTKAVPGAIQLSNAARKQMKGRPNSIPWLLFFSKLESNIQETTRAAFLPQPEAVLIDWSSNNEAVIQIRIAPAFGDPPETLCLDLFSGTRKDHLIESPILDEEEILIADKVVLMNVPREMFVGGGGNLLLAYRLHGMSVQNNVIEQNGRWSFRELGSRPTDISLEQSRMNWPGASGEPVGIHRGYHGREHEMKIIESHICRKDRPGSIMIFGQRRIGKTSFLRELVRSHPPGRGDICGAFVDISGLTFSGDQESMRDALFSKIIGALESESDNLLIRKAIHDQIGHSKIGRLFRGIEPRAGIANALEKLADRINETTGGVISRIAFFMDEFDKFVKPLFQRQEKEVDALMWDLRQIVQRSEKVALVFAGSGMQRLLISKPKDALFGSIPEISLEPFDWSKDKDAIGSTFMPMHVRQQLCENEYFNCVAERAYELCGGFPWFLSMFGYSTAVLSKGQQVSPSFLNFVLDKMVGGDLRTMAISVDAGRFYKQSVFESLDVLSLREKALAKLVLAQIAQYMSAEHQWIKIRVVVEAPDLLELAQAKERDLLYAIDKLEKERVVERNETGEVRISIPLTARALSEDSLSIREEALSDLKST